MSFDKNMVFYDVLVLFGVLSRCLPPRKKNLCVKSISDDSAVELVCRDPSSFFANVSSLLRRT